MSVAETQRKASGGCWAVSALVFPPAGALGGAYSSRSRSAPISRSPATLHSATVGRRGPGMLWRRYRARCTCLLIGSPRLFDPECRTVEDVRLANAFRR